MPGWLVQPEIFIGYTTEKLGRMSYLFGRTLEPC